MKRSARIVGVVPCLLIASSIAGCRWQSSVSTPEKTNPNGSGTGSYVASCSGDFPDWIVPNAPAGTDTKHFQLSQAYPLGVPVLKTVNGNTTVVQWNPPTPDQDAPWRAYPDLSNPTQRTQYLNALKEYLLAGMSDSTVNFDAVLNNSKPGNRKWYHVPMMTAAGTRRREPFHGVTAERALRPSEQVHWVNGSSLINAVAIGYYNSLGGYTIGQVFPSYDLSKTDPTKAAFVDGAYVFKLLFAQYDPTRIIAPDPLAHAPEWQVQVADSLAPGPNNSAPAPFKMIPVRLLQVDVAVKDDHQPLGWTFATFVYDESLAASEPNPWRRLTPVGIQWGDDPAVTGTASASLSETWINSARPAAFLDHLGRAGRLVGPIDNPTSSCMSCHSTAEVDTTKVGDATGYLGAAMIPPNSCAASDQMYWFRDVHGGTPFGHANSCPPNPSTAGLVSTDYSLQLQEGLDAVYGFQNGNPCASVAKQYHDSTGDAEAADKMKKRMLSASNREMVDDLRPVLTPAQVQVKPEGSFIAPDNDEAHQR